MNDDPLLTIDEVAEYLRTPVTSIYRWRQHGTGPQFIKVGRRILCRSSVLAAFIKEQEKAERRRTAL